MKNTNKLLSLILALVVLTSLAACGAAPAPAADDAADNDGGAAAAAWTVLMYFCGTDLESDGGMATVNLEEIASTVPNEEVNVVIQTGGTKKWQAEASVGLDIDENRLQRYSYDADGFTLVYEDALKNMASAETLSDFIRWGTAEYPADKYMLVLWDHGGGSSGGLIVDEKHGGAIMSLEDLGHALADSGAHMEALVLDTCLMASLETAQAVKTGADYLIASEEVVAGEGSAYGAWLQYLYDVPECTGAQFGRSFCDFAQQKYAEQGTGGTSSFITFSVIDLSRIDAVTDAFAQLFTELSALLSDPEAFGTFAYFAGRTEHYMLSTMVDLADFAARGRDGGLSRETVNAVLAAVDDAVLYSIKGPTRSYSHGLSFYYDPTASAGSLDRYARSSANPAYLAFLDAVNMGWTAPAWVYDTVERLPEISYDDYVVEAEVSGTEDGHLRLDVTNAAGAVDAVDALLLSYDEASGRWISYGRWENVEADFDAGVFTDRFDGRWLMFNGAPCNVEINEETDTHVLYNIPGVITEEDFTTEGVLRAGYIYDTPLWSNADYAADGAGGADAEEETDPYAGHFEFYGLWNSLDSAIEMPGRDVYDMSALYGAEFVPYLSVYSVDTGRELGTAYGTPVMLTNDLALAAEALPAGTYAYAFIVRDVFGNELTVTPVVFTWDGESAVFELEDDAGAETDAE